MFTAVFKNQNPGGIDYLLLPHFRIFLFYQPGFSLEIIDGSHTEKDRRQTLLP
jgi:hypothetical protein